MALLEGVAKGGPRDNVKLQCPENWNGKIVKNSHGPSYYPGRYVFDINEFTWVWKELEDKHDALPSHHALKRTRPALTGYKYR